MKKRTAIRRSTKPLLPKRDARWMGVRKQAWERANGECENCGRLTPLNEGHGHHSEKRSVRPARKYDLSNIKFLCPGCHLLAHGISLEAL